jgi:(p)ppGpp synthase/HD superfamily hydrolase
VKPEHPELLERAIRVAVRQHEGQLRKADDQPFITHPVAVALLVARFGLGVKTIAAALLHDVLEDTDMEPSELADAVDGRVARIVEEVTKEEGERLSWAERSRRYVEKLRTASPDALAVAAADKIHNLFALMLAHEREGEVVFERFNASSEERLATYEEVRDVIRMRWPDCPLLPELDRQLERARQELL